MDIKMELKFIYIKLCIAETAIRLSFVKARDFIIHVYSDVRNNVLKEFI